MKGLPLLVLAMSVGAGGCAKEASQPAPTEKSQNESARMSNEAKGAPEAEPDSSAPPLLAALIRSATAPIPAALNQGRFRINGDCLEFVAAGIAYTPALPAPPRRGDGRFALGARTFPLDLTYVVSGGPVAGTDPLIEVPEAVRASCPARYYLIAAIEQP
jgi:hypothetical protein